MKRIVSLLILGALAAALSVPAMAQSAGPRGGGVQQGGPAAGPGAQAGQRGGGARRMQEMFAKLDLSPDQKKQIAALEKSHMEALKALREKAKGATDKQAIQQELRTLNQENRKSIMAILTPDQKKRLQQLMKEARQNAPATGAGKPGKGGKGGQ